MMSLKNKSDSIVSLTFAKHLLYVEVKRPMKKSTK